MRIFLIIILAVMGFFLVASIEACLGIMSLDYSVPIVLNDTKEYDLAIFNLIGNDLAPLIFLLISFVLFSWLLGLYRKVTRIKRSASTTEREAITKPFILYLRSFVDEKSTKKRIKRLSDIRSEEEMLIDVFTDIAPVYAIGDPADKKMPYGATRIYVDDSKWKKTVEELAQNAEIVILRLGQTNNFWWEVNMVLKTVSIEKIVFVIPWSKNFTNVSTLYKILLEHKIDISNLNISIDKKRYGSISSVLFFIDDTPVSKEIILPRFTGVFFSYDNLLRNALSPYREKFGFKPKKRLPILKARISLLAVMFVLILCIGGRFYGHLMELKYQRPYELVEECIKDNDFVAKYGNEINGTSLTWALVGTIMGKLVLNDEDFIQMLLIENIALNQASRSEYEQLFEQPHNTLLVIKKYAPDYYLDYVNIASKASLMWLKYPEVATSELDFYKQNIDKLPPWVGSFGNNYGNESDENFNRLFISEAMKHIDEPDFSVTMKTLMAQSINFENQAE